MGHKVGVKSGEKRTVGQREKRGKKSGVTKVGREKWGTKWACKVRKRKKWGERREKVGVRKVGARKVWQSEKLGEKSGAGA